MKQRLQRLLPNAESVRHNRWLRWIGPALHHPQLWRITRRGVALGVGLGIFFGLLVPVAQIPLSAAAAVFLRANIPTAIASTLVTNPVTFAPIYYAAYHLGARLIGDDGGAQGFETAQTEHGEAGWIERIAALGKPLLLGLLILSSSMGTLAYLLISGLWRLKISLAWRRRHRTPADGNGKAD
ncbi:MAG: DUF2062 domain-containing protein [Gallionella sp.]|nr:DUF2062 domain-containing protein [Gallionella sp.]